jgi:cell division protein FtsB
VRDERDQKIAELTAENAALRALVAELRAQVEELKRQLGQNSL